MDKKFKLLNRPIEGESCVTEKNIIEFKEITAVVETWSFLGVTGNSLVYLTEDAKAFKKEELINSLFLQMNVPRDPELIYKEVGEFVYITYGIDSFDS